MEILNNSKYEVLTDEGFKDFKGLSISDRNDIIKFKTKNGKTLKCTSNHKLFFTKENSKQSKEFNVNDKFFTVNDEFDEIIEIKKITKNTKVYDLLSVEDTHSFLCNDIKISNCLVLDEFAFVESAEEFYSSTFPTISSGNTTKLVVISTPNGYNLFHKLWTDSLAKRNDFAHVKVIWSDVPGRDLKWKKEQIANSSEELFAQEHECSFESSTKGLIKAEKIAEMMKRYKNPIKTDENKKLNIYEEPKENEQYLLCIDTAKGIGFDYSTIQIIKISKTPYEIVATYRCNDISYLVFPEIIYKIARIYNNGYLLIESNEYGHSVGTTLATNDKYNYENIIWTKFEAKNNKERISYADDGKSVPGVRTTERLKHIGCSNLKVLIENDKLTIKDYETISELSSFVKVKDGWKADTGKHDDLVAPLWLFGWLTTQDFFKDIEQNVAQEIRDLFHEEILGMIKTVGFIVPETQSGGYDVLNTEQMMDYEDDGFDDDFLWERAKDLEAVNLPKFLDNNYRYL